jgi:phosphonate metabolism protein (transferase hexapeptide repeat family)
VTRLNETPWINPTATVKRSSLGKYTEIGAGCHVSDATLGDYSYCVENTQIAYAQIGKFANIAAHVRIYASRHPTDLASLHHFTYRSSWYFEDAKDNAEFFAWRGEQTIMIGHDTWIGHGAVIMPGVTVGNGAVIGSNAVVTRDVPPYAIAVGVPAKVIKQRYSDETVQRMEKLAWWDWPHDVLHERLADFRSLPAVEFLDKYEA